MLINSINFKNNIIHPYNFHVCDLLHNQTPRTRILNLNRLV